MKNYRKKPVVVEAVQWWGPFLGDGKQGPAVVALQEWGCTVAPTEHWGGACNEPGHENNADLIVGTLEDGAEGSAQVEHIASPGDWIIRGVKGEFYPVKPEIFEATYEPA